MTEKKQIKEIVEYLTGISQHFDKADDFLDYLPHFSDLAKKLTNIKAKK